MSIVSNTGPLIALAKAGQLGLLASLYGEVRIPPTVHRELLAKSGVEAERLDSALVDFVQVTELPEPTLEVQLATQSLDSGERDAVTLAHHLNLSLLIDDRLGRQSASRLSVIVTGTVGVILLAKQEGLIPLVKPLLERIRDNGYWLADELIAVALSLANE
jgi:hypothetical protein